MKDLCSSEQLLLGLNPIQLIKEELRKNKIQQETCLRKSEIMHRQHTMITFARTRIQTRM